MVKMIQPSMAGGEVSAAVGARVDLSKRAVAVERAENFVATFTGAMASRPGQRFVAQCKPGAGPHRIIEFEFNTTQTFVLEMGDQYMRFHTLGAQVLDSDAVKTITAATQADPCVITSAAHGLSDGDEVYVSDVVGMTELNGRNFLVSNAAANTFELQDLSGSDVDASAYSAYVSGGEATPPYEITAPWAAADLFELNYAQSGDVMTLCHPDYPPQELIRIANDDWTLSAIAFEPDQAGARAISVSVLTDVTSFDITNITQADPAVITTSAAHGLSVGDRIYIEGVSGPVELNTFQYEVLTVPSTTTFTFGFIGEDDAVDTTGFLAYGAEGTVTPVIRPRRYTVTAVNSDDQEQSLPGTAGDDAGMTIIDITQANPAVVTTTDGHGLEDFDTVKFIGVDGMTELNEQAAFRVTRLSHTTFSVQLPDGTDVDSTGFGAFTGVSSVRRLFVTAQGSADAEWNNSLTWGTVAGAEYYNVYASDNSGIMGFLGSTTGLRFEDKNLGPDYAVTPPGFFNPFDDFVDGTDKYPGTTGFFQQRRWFAKSNLFPNRFWASQVGHFSNMARSIPALADDSIAATIAARRINEINHIVPLTDLIILTSGGEYRIKGDQNGAITPSPNVSPQSYYGSTKVRPIVAGDVGLFVSPGDFVRDLSYQFSDDKFIGKDVTILARHLFEYRTIVDWDYAPAPRAVGFVVMSDGGGCFLTYQPDQDVYAWTRASTLGKYKSTCVIREGDNDVIYVTVERVINGTTVTFLERMDEHQFETLEDAFCVDAGLSLDNPIGGGVASITATDPVVVTTNTAHGLSNGDFVDISDVFEIDTTVNEGASLSADYNGTGFEVANVTATTFELVIEGADYDGSAFATFSSGGTVREAVTTVSGLWHLEGAAVVAAGNGYAEQDLTVTNGEVTLAARASRIHIGLGYFCRLKTLPLTRYADGQTTDGKAKNIHRLTVQVDRTMGMWFGPSEGDLMREAKFGLPSLYGQPLEMVTDDIDVTMKADWGKRKQVVIEQRDPLPLTILTLVPDARLGGN